ncbi:SDR family NAD(P)-dependent oxidoreductase [Ignavibacteria bacterium]|nr:SDR family NAD(P)-dependent oxidoreductase [Bacteroidota bacterium]MCZ2132296.1 SDR family NAD(P)-dependent oxidoreductase [Bacteroidota bacterium]
MNGKIALITGASSGIGLGCAEVFAEAGARLIIVARRKERLDALADKLRQNYNSDVLVRVCDIRERNDVFALAETLPDEWKNIDILINNAGLSRGLDKLQAGSVDDWEEMIDVNIKGLLYMTRAVLPGMIERAAGMIINIASVAGRMAYPSGNVYCATKSAVRTISESLQLDVNGTGVRVCNIDPGLVETEFSLVRFRGNAARAEMTYRGFLPLSGCDVAEAALFCATRPPYVSIQDLLIMPTAQASPYVITKNN